MAVLDAIQAWWQALATIWQVVIAVPIVLFVIKYMDGVIRMTSRDVWWIWLMPLAWWPVAVLGILIWIVVR